jgi:hypothetical protein
MVGNPGPVLEQAKNMSRVQPVNWISIIYMVINENLVFQTNCDGVHQ